MGKGAFINIKNWACRPVNVAVGNVNNMGNGLDPSALGGTLQPGAMVLSNGTNAYLESSGFGQSTFNLTFTYADNQQVIGHINFTENNGAYNLALNDNPGVLMCSWFNPVYPLQQAYISIAVLPFTLNWTTWMSDWPELGNVQLGQLCIPGTHDSGTYVMQPYTQDSGFKGTAAGLLKMSGVVQTQVQSVGEVPNFKSSLVYGARYFDLRPGGLLSDADLFSNSLFHVHSPDTSTVIACAPMQEILNGVNSFAQAHPKELIFLNFSHLTTAATNTFTFTNPYNNQQVQNASAAYSLKFLAASQIYNALAGVMLPPTPVTTTFNEIWATGKNVVCLIDCSDGITFGSGNGQIDIAPAGQPSAASLFWQITPSTPYLSGWNNYANEDEPDALMNWLQRQFSNGTYTAALPGTINLLQCQCTPSNFDVFRDVMGNNNYSILDTAAQSNLVVQSQYGIHIAPNSPLAQAFAKSVNIFLTDGFDGTATNWAVASNLYRMSQS